MVVLLAVDVIQTQRIKNYQDEITIRDTIIKKITFSAQKLEFLENSLYRTILFDHTKMTGYELTDTTGKMISGNQIIHKTPILVIRYKDGNCPECITFAFSRMISFAKKYGISPVIMTEYPDFHLFKKNSRSYNIERWPCYSITEVSKLDELNTPYCFVLNPDMTMSAVFIPEKALPSVTSLYLQGILDRFFTVDQNN